MNEVTLYNYWKRELSVKKLRESNNLLVKYNCKAIFCIVALILGIAALIIVGSVFEGQKSKLLLSVALISGILFGLLYWIEKKVDYFKLYLNEDGKNSSIYELRELRINSFVKEYCSKNELDVDNMYSVLIELCEDRSKAMLSISFSNYFAVLAIFIGIFSFLFTGENRWNIIITAYYLLLAIIILLTVILFIIKYTIERDKGVYMTIRLILRRSLLEKKVVKKNRLESFLSDIVSLSKNVTGFFNKREYL